MDKLPKQAKKVFKGVIFDVYQWRQKMFDGKYTTFERVKRQDTVVILPTIKDKIVMLKQKQPNTGWFLTLPSGRMDKPGETPKHAALRELMEETGLKPGKFKLWRKVRAGEKIFHTIYFYLARDCVKIGPLELDNGEKIKVLLFSFDDYLKLSDKNNFVSGELLQDIFMARLHKPYYNQLKKEIFG